MKSIENLNKIDFDTFLVNGYSREVFKDFIRIQIAISISQLSTAKRMKCGCILLRDGYTLSSGYNGTMPKDSNICENNDFTTNNISTIHAEQNCLAFADTSIDGYYSLYSTHLPCEECMKLCILKGVNEIIYSSDYRGKKEYIKHAKKYLKIKKIEISMNSIYGIYIDDELVYIGSSIRPIDRWDTHITYLKSGKHSNKLLQNTYNESIDKNILITTLKYCPFDSEHDMRKYEYELIKRYKPPCNQQMLDSHVDKIMSGIVRNRKEKNNYNIDIDLEKIYMLKKSGKTTLEISRKFNCSYSTIQRRINLMKIYGYNL